MKNWKRWLWIIAILYWLMPFDLFSDFHLGLGWIDDLLIGAACYYIWQYIKGRSETYQDFGYSQAYNDYSYWQSGYESYKDHGDSSRTSHDKWQSHTNKDPYEILGVTRGATLDEIKKAYHRKANKYHPDKVSHLGEEFQKLAEEKFKEINWAFETLKTERGL